MMHAFRPSVALAFGVEEAIMLNNLIYWIKKNQANKRHQHDGRTWTYNTLDAFTEQFEYWTIKQIRRILDNLEKSGVMVTGRYNKKGYDKTKWYALYSESMTDEDFDFLTWSKSHCPNGQMNCPNGQKKLPKWANQNAQKGKPIPDNISDNIPDVSLNTNVFKGVENFEDVISEFKTQGEPEPTTINFDPLTPPNFRATPPKEKQPTETYSMYEAWARFSENKGIPVSKSKTGSYLFEPKHGQALKQWRTWVAGMPNFSGDYLADWEAFLEAAWTKGGKWIQSNFTPTVLNSKRMEIVIAVYYHRTQEDPELLKFVENLGKDIDISDLL